MGAECFEREITIQKWNSHLQPNSSQWPYKRIYQVGLTLQMYGHSDSISWPSGGREHQMPTQYSIILLSDDCCLPKWPNILLWSRVKLRALLLAVPLSEYCQWGICSEWLPEFMPWWRLVSEKNRDLWQHWFSRPSIFTPMEHIRKLESQPVPHILMTTIESFATESFIHHNIHASILQHLTCPCIHFLMLTPAP